MSAKRPAAPLDQAAVKRSRVQEEAVAHEASRHAAASQPSKTAHTRAAPSSNSAAHVGSRGVAREQSAHSQAGSHGTSHAAGALNMSAAQRAPRAAHSGSPAAAPRSGYTNVVGASPKSSSGAGLSFSSLKQPSGQSQSQSQSSTAALASLLPLLYGTGSGERNLEVAAAQLASGALKQTASGQSQSLLSSLTSPLSNMNIASLGTLLNYQMAAAIQKLGAPAATKKESPGSGNSHTHAHASASARPSFPKSAANAPPTPPATQKQALASGALNVPLNLTGASSGATLHHHASQQSNFAGYGTSDAPIDLSKKTSAAAPPKVRSSVPLPPPAAKMRAPEPTRADSAVPVNDVRLERERERGDHHARSDVTRSGENAPVTRERDRTPQTDKMANGEAERQIPVITLSDDDAESDDDESAALFDEELAEVERLSAPLTDDPESPVDRAALLAARKRLVRELRRSLVDEEARIELLRRWNSHNAVNAREQPKAGTLNGKAAQTQAAAAQARTPKGTPQLPASAKRELTRTASAAATPQPAHAHGAAAVLNGGPPNVTINQQPAHGGLATTPGSVPLKVPRVSSSSELTKSATTTPRGPQSALANTSATSGKTQSAATSQRGTPQLNAAQLQAQLAASKLSLRKQVEKTLGQLAPPKPVAGTDIQFVPSVNYTDLLCLVGLDETVNALQRFETASSSSKNALASNAAVPSNGVVPNDTTANDSANANGLPNGAPQPAAESKRSASGSAASQIRTCIQCETDFTPTWRVAERSLLNAAAQKRLTALRETAPRSTTFHVCERCAVHNLKKTTRSDYLTKLKQTFTQLARDERELEERYTSLIAQAPQSVPNSNSAAHNSSSSLHATPSGSNRSVNAVQNALKEAQQLLSASGSASNSGRGTSSPTPASSLANSLSSLGAGSQSFNSASALNAFTAFTAAMNAAANAMKTGSPSASALNLNAANLGSALNASGLNASALASGLNSSPLGVGGALNPASLSAALQAFLSLQNPSFSAGSSRGTSSSAHSTAANTNASGSSLSAFPSQFGEAARSSAASFGVNSQPSASSGASPVKTANDLHRQYYLEMVTRPPVLPNWKK